MKENEKKSNTGHRISFITRGAYKMEGKITEIRFIIVYISIELQGGDLELKYQRKWETQLRKRSDEKVEFFFYSILVWRN